MQYITPLPRRIQPHPWEDLGSFLVRTAKEMGYEKPHWLLKPEISSWEIKAWELPILSSQGDYDFLSQLFLLPEASLHQMTLHRFSSLFETPPEANEGPFLQQNQSQETTRRFPWSPIAQPLLPRNYGWSVLSKSWAVRICPLCATTPEAYDRLYWRLDHLLTCPLHGVLLQTACPACSKKWPSLRVSEACCPSCHHPIQQDEKAYHIQNHPEFSYLLQGDWLTLYMAGYKPGPENCEHFSLEQDPRASLSPTYYFRLFNHIINAVAWLDKQTLLSLLNPSFQELVTLLRSSIPITSRKRLSPWIAITHWVFAGGRARIFDLIDALSFF